MEDVLNLIRVFTVVIFAYAAWRDVKTRRVNDLVWVVLSTIGIVVFALDMYTSPHQVREYKLFLYFLSVFPIGLIGVVFARLKLFGWADAGGFIAIGVLFPMILPVDTVVGFSFPIFITSAGGIMSYAILLNSSILALVTPILITARNLYHGEFEIPYGIYLLPLSTSGLWNNHGLVAYSTDENWVRGADIDVIRRYLQWRGCSVDDVLLSPSSHRDMLDASRTNESVSSWGITSNPDEDCFLEEDSNLESDSHPADDLIDLSSDPWAVSLFVESTDVNLYGSTENEIRKSLNQLFISEESARISVGQPFLLFLFSGVLFTFFFGSIYHILSLLFEFLI